MKSLPTVSFVHLASDPVPPTHHLLDALAEGRGLGRLLSITRSVSLRLRGGFFCAPSALLGVRRRTASRNLLQT